MRNISRLAALALTFSFALLLPGGASTHCASHGSAAKASTMDHMVMASVAGPGDRMQAADDGRCDDCSLPDGHSCDATAALGCASMASCTTPSAELISTAAGVNATELLIVDAHVPAPPSPTLSQDTPPPRV